MKMKVVFAMVLSLTLSGSQSPVHSGILLPHDLPNKEWIQFNSPGFQKPVCGVMAQTGHDPLVAGGCNPGGGCCRTL